MDILISGSVAYDYLMTFPGIFRDHILPDKLDSISLSFLVDDMQKQRGGAASNIAFSLSLFGIKPRIWATVGEDFGNYRNWLEKNGINTEGMKVINGKFTASFFVTTDKSQAQIASFYTGAMGDAYKHSLTEIKNHLPDLVVISPNDPRAMTLYVEECTNMGIDYVYDPSQQICRLTKNELRIGIQNAKSLFVNEYEFALIRKETSWDLDKMISKNPEIFVVITKGAHGAQITTAEKDMYIPVATIERVVEPTGAGDAFRGGFFAGLSKGFEYELCGQMGTLTAAYCLETNEPQGHKFSIEDFISRFRKHFDDHGNLEVFLNGGLQ